MAFLYLHLVLSGQKLGCLKHAPDKRPQWGAGRQNDSSPGDSPSACQRLTWPQQGRDLSKTERWSPNKERVGKTPGDLAPSLPALQGQGLPPQGSWAAGTIAPLPLLPSVFQHCFWHKTLKGSAYAHHVHAKRTPFCYLRCFFLLFLKTLCFHSVGWRSSLQLCAKPLNFLPTVFFSCCFQPCH